MEDWMHSVNTKVKVIAARKVIAQVLRMLKKIFPRRTGNGYNIPKFHGLTKILDYMCLFGSALNFFGGPGESHHKYFVKAPGDNTQRRVSEFAKQIANRIYENMIAEIAKEALNTLKEHGYIKDYARTEDNRSLFYKKDISLLARNGFDFETSKRIMDIDKEDYEKAAKIRDELSKRN